jgi:pyruvate/2-oxoglutarate dehydrogenase complex dihydrolipoamide dehydrogenase (E3) component
MRGRDHRSRQGPARRRAGAAGHSGRQRGSAGHDVGDVIAARLQANGYTGRAKAVVDEDSRTLVGFTLVGPAVVDHLHAATVAVTAEVPIDRLWHAVPAFPTASEFWLSLMETYGL